MTRKNDHFMEEADIGSGEKTPAQLDDLKKTSHLNEDETNNRNAAKPLDGSHLWQVVEEQKYINQQENHVTQGPSQGANLAHETAPAPDDDGPRTASHGKNPDPAKAGATPAHRER